MNAIEEEFHFFGGERDMAVMEREMSRVTKYMPYIPHTDMSEYDPYFLKILHAKSTVRDGEPYLKK